MTRSLGCRFLMVATLGFCTVAAQGENAQTRRSFEQAAGSLAEQLAASLAELSRLRESIAAERIPLSRALADLEAELQQVRATYQDRSRTLDTRTLDLENLRRAIQARQEEAAYLGNLLNEYLRNFESRLHIAELKRHEEALKTAKLAAENTALARREVFQANLALLSVSLERLEDALGGDTFQGSAVDPNGLVQHGRFAMLGPVALFRSDDGRAVGTAEQRLGSLEPAVIPFANPLDAAAAARLVETREGAFPLDPTQGNAHKIEATQETLLEHVQKGGPVMAPIFALAGLALLVALYKWIHLSRVRAPSPARVRTLLAAVAAGDRDAAQREAAAIRGPAGRMLVAGAEHLGEPRELVEEVMYEQVLATRLSLQRLLPFIAITASSAPLLGLLGTVTGIMNTFSLMTVFGTGDVKTLSSGIAEALITTEYGLYVAIPALLLHAFLSRKAKAILDQMEKAAIGFVNQVSKTPAFLPKTSANGDGGASRAAFDDAGRIAPVDQVREALAGILAPLVHRPGVDESARTQPS